MNSKEQMIINDIVRILLTAYEAVPGAHLGHGERTASIAVAIAGELGLHKEDLRDIRYAAALHDIGMIGLPEQLRMQSSQYNNEAKELIKQHPIIGCQILQKSEALFVAGNLILFHHERWDGSGYPHGLKGDNIPIGSRILSVSEVYDYLTRPPSWKKTFTKEEAVNEIKKGSNTQFDPKVVEAFLKVVDVFSFI